MSVLLVKLQIFISLRRKVAYKSQRTMPGELRSLKDKIIRTGLIMATR